MESAMTLVGAPFAKQHAHWPDAGLCLIQWTGPWSARPYRGSNLSQTHWVATACGFVFDVNWGSWLPKQNWEEVVLPELLLRRPSATGWEPLTAYEL